MFKKFLSPEWLLVILAITTAVVPVLPLHFGKPGKTTISSLSFSSGVLALNDSLPHYIYKRAADSMMMLEQRNESISRSIGSGLFFHSVGCSKLNDEYIRTDERRPAVNDSYYLSLGGYRLDEGARFKVEGNHWLIETPVWDVVRKTEEGYYRNGHYVSQPVRIRYATEPGDSQAAGRVLIPVSHQKFMFLEIALWTFIITGALFVVYAVLIIPTSIIVRIANGKGFSKRNYSALYFAGWTMLAIALLPVIIGLTMRFAFRAMLPPEVHYFFVENLLQYKGVLLAGLITLLLARAFQKGYELQLDNNSII